jgi:hypothetical protein
MESSNLQRFLDGLAFFALFRSFAGRFAVTEALLDDGFLFPLISWTGTSFFLGLASWLCMPSLGTTEKKRLIPFKSENENTFSLELHTGNDKNISNHFKRVAKTGDNAHR